MVLHAGDNAKGDCPRRGEWMGLIHADPGFPMGTTVEPTGRLVESCLIRYLFNWYKWNITNITLK